MEMMDLFGYVGGGLTPVYMRVNEDPGMESTGQATVAANGEGGFTITSSFSINTQIKIGGDVWRDADAPVTMELVAVGPPVPALGNMGIGALVGTLVVAGVVLRRRARPAAS
jgi:hypothetical protein